MGSIIGSVPGGLGMGQGRAIPGAINYQIVKWGVMRQPVTPVQPAIAVTAAVYTLGPCFS